MNKYNPEDLEKSYRVFESCIDAFIDEFSNRYTQINKTKNAYTQEPTEHLSNQLKIQDDEIKKLLNGFLIIEEAKEYCTDLLKSR